MQIKSRDLVKLLEQNGWELDRVRGSHHQFKKEGYIPVTVPHPKKDLPKGLVRKIMKDAGL